MKKIFMLLIIVSALLGLSIPSFAYTTIQPSSLSFLSERGNSYVLNTKLQVSSLSSDDLEHWKNFINIYTGKTDGHYIISSTDTAITFLFMSSNTTFYNSNSSYAIVDVPSGGYRCQISFNLSSGLFSGSQFINGFHKGQFPSCTIIKTSYSSLPTKVSRVVDFNEKDLHINDDLGSFNVQHNLTINYQYSNGTQAFETYTNTFSEGDSFSIPSPTLGGFKPSINIISGQMGNTDLSYTVTYTPINHSVTVNYQYENGSQALAPYSGTFSEGQPYSIPTPAIKGYTPSLNIISGEMGTSDLSYTVIFTKVKEPDPPLSSSGNSSSENSGSSSSANGGYVVWNPSFMAKGFQNVSNMIGIAFNTFIWLFLGITGIFIIIKLVRHLFK